MSALRVLSLLIAGVSACRRAPPPVQRDPTPSAPSIKTVVTADPAAIPADLRVTMLMTMCYGQCPAYAVTIDARGHVAFIGEAFVKTPRAEATLPEADLRKVVAAIDAARFFALGDVNEGWKDCTRSKTSITMRGQTHVVRNGCVGAASEGEDVKPDALPLERLDEEIDRILGTERWIGPESERLRLFDEPDAATAKTTPELDYWR